MLKDFMEKVNMEIYIEENSRDLQEKKKKKNETERVQQYVYRGVWIRNSIWQRYENAQKDRAYPFNQKIASYIDFFIFLA